MTRKASNEWKQQGSMGTWTWAFGLGINGIGYCIIPVMSNWNWYMGDFWNPLYSHPWTIPKTISEIITPFSSLTISFLS
jgi:hypothetical protein